MAKTINVKDIWYFNAELRSSGDDFVLVAHNEKYNVRLHCERGLASNIAEELWKYIDNEDKKNKNVKDSLNKQRE